MDWQQLVALLIVAAAAMLLLRGWVHKRKFRFKHDMPCGCAAAGSSTSAGSIVFHARKGQRPEVIVKMK